MLYYIFSFIFVFLFFHLFWKRRSLPPGPIPLPFIGNMLQFGYYGFEEAISKIHKNYGDLHTLWFGNTPVISLNDYPTMIEKFVKNGDSFSGREESTLFLEVSKGGPYGITFIDGPLWRDQRKFGLKVLRDLGMGKDVMQEKVLVEVSALLEEVKDGLKSNKNVVNMQDLMDLAVGSVINSIVLGYRFDKTNKAEFYKLKEDTSAMFRVYGNPLWKIMENGPKFYRNLPFFNGVYMEMENACNNMRKFLEKQIENHKADYKLGKDDESPSDYVEAFLQQQHALKKAGEEGHFFSDKQLYGAVWDLWVAGQETTATGLAWIIYYITAHQNCQEKIHQELDQVIGNDRIVTTDDRNNLPFLNATILEVIRHASIAPINLLHRTLEDVEIHGHSIPSNTLIVDNFATVFKDPRYFENPEQFLPERFIDEKDGKFAPRPEVNTFGYGKRACVGEGLAKMELFLFISNIFNHFKLSQAPSKPFLFKRYVGSTTLPEAYVVQVESRF